MTRNAENALVSWRHSSLVEEKPALDGLMIKVLKANLRYLRAAIADHPDITLQRWAQRNNALACFELTAEKVGHQSQVMMVVEKTLYTADRSAKARAAVAEGLKEMSKIPASKYRTVVLKTPEAHCQAIPFVRKRTARPGLPPWSQQNQDTQRSGN